MAMCEHTWLDGEVWNCWLMKKPCPFIKPEYNDLCIDRIVVTGAKFIYKNNCLKYVILKGFYKLDGNLIPQNFPKRLYNSNCILDYTDDEMILINQLLSEARKYIYGKR
ncbi:hypothetical protein [Megamonas funiformis]|uniref:hypothetical protein n=1 Tax=Megamonas funiformis TaxID=437897 RepID=UPI00242E4585|nr:hypothetical protein [Megamonas funiformis]